MSKPRLYKTEAIILKGSDMGEADRLLTFYTPYLGKLRAVAKGARKPQSKLGGHVETLTHSLMMLAQGHTLDVVSQSQTLHSFLPLREDLGRLSLALYAADLVNSFTEERLENPPIFHLLRDTLEWLSKVPDGASGHARDIVLRHFELHLLEYLGYQPQLQHCVHCHHTLEPVTNFFSPSAGGTVCPHCRPKALPFREPSVGFTPTWSGQAGERQTWVRPLSVNALKCLRLFQTSPREGACRVKLGEELALELKQHLQGYIRYLLERDIKSATWIDRLQGTDCQL